MRATVAETTAAGVAITYVTWPEPMEQLVAFYRSVRPARPGWEPVARLADDVGQPSLFSIGRLIFRRRPSSENLVFTYAELGPFGRQAVPVPSKVGVALSIAVLVLVVGLVALAVLRLDKSLARS